MYKNTCLSVVFVFILAITVACSGEDNEKDSDIVDGDMDSSQSEQDVDDLSSDGDFDDNLEIDKEPALEEDQSGEIDIEDPDGDADPEKFIPPNLFTCQQAGYEIADFQDVTDNAALYSVAADFTVVTSNGPWNLQDNWTGCETYLFIQDTPKQATGWPTALWERDVDTLLAKLPDNAHLFFLSNQESTIKILERLSGIKNRVEDYTSTLSTPERNRWYHRIHYVVEPAKGISGWLGQVMSAPGWGVGIDRFQKIRYIGSYADYSRWSDAKGWFAPNISMAANEAVYYNFEAERDAQLQSENATVLNVFDAELLSDPDWAGVKGYADIEFPDASEMANYDSMEFDLYLGCNGNGEYGTCPAWDYLVHLYLCEKENPDVCNIEFGRWITTYHREGRWVHDVSGLLPLVSDGGTRRVAFYTQQPYEVSLSVRLFNQAKTHKPQESIFLFSGGSFGPDYNDKYEPVPIEIPANAGKVEIATVISGHGMETPGNCAEFCNTTHHFIVNGNDNILDFPIAGTDEGCMDQVSKGAVPNQYGTWWFGRSGWCPGMEVPLVMTDVTDQITPGEENVFEYQGLFNDAPYTNGGANIRLSSWLVISETASSK